MYAVDASGLGAMSSTEAVSGVAVRLSSGWPSWSTTRTRRSVWPLASGMTPAYEALAADRLPTVTPGRAHRWEGTFRALCW